MLELEPETVFQPFQNLDAGGDDFIANPVAGNGSDLVSVHGFR